MPAAPTQGSDLFHGCHSQIAALLLHPHGKTDEAEKRRIISAAIEEMDNILHVVITAAENYDYSNENRNIGKTELTTAVYELTKLQRLITAASHNW